MSRTGGGSADDITCLKDELSEEDIFSFLQKRWNNGAHATRFGYQTLVILNSQRGRAAAEESVLAQYVRYYKDTSEQRSPVAPHVYEMTCKAYLLMRRTGLDQSLVICGATASGKSEARRQVIQMIGALRSQNKKESKLIRQVEHATTVLEAFGNARTTENGNASRYGTFTELQFSERGRVIGAKLLTYLFEKSRASHVPAGERNFHVFYHVVFGAAAEEKEKWGLGEAGTYPYLGAGRSTRSTGVDEAEALEKLRTALKALGFGRKYQAQIFQLLVTVLNIGLIGFVDDPRNNQEACTVRNQEHLGTVAAALGISADTLETVLTYKTKLIKKEMCSVFLDAEAAQLQRNELARVLYSLLFNWIVEHINTKLCSDTQANFIGILDMIGFQHGRQNGFEQLCANFANERLCRYFQHQQFEASVEELVDEEPPSPPLQLDYNNNAECVDMFVRPSSGLIVLMDKQVNRKRAAEGTDAAMLNTFTKHHADNPFFIKPTKNTHTSFGIRHYGGTVNYVVTGFTEQNSDTLSADFVGLFRGSEGMRGTANQFIAGLFSEATVATESHPRNENTIVTAQQPAVPTRAPSMRRKKTADSAGAASSRKPKVSCVLSQVQEAMQDLVDALQGTMPWFVVCVRTSLHADAANFDSVAVRAQIHSLDLAAVAKRAQHGEFSVSMTHAEFLVHFERLLAPMEIDRGLSEQQQCLVASQVLNLAASDGFVGHTKVFLDGETWRALEDILRSAESEERRNVRSGPQPQPLDAAQGDEYYYEGGEAPDDRGSERSYGSRQQLVPPMPQFMHTGQVAHPGQLMHPQGMRHSYYSEDGRSTVYGGAGGHGEDEQGYRDTESVADSEFASASQFFDEASTAGIEMKRAGPGGFGTGSMADEDYEAIAAEEEAARKRKTVARRNWECVTWGLTWWIPSVCLSSCGGMKRKDVQMAWREKVALCLLIAFVCLVCIFYLTVFGALICPRQYVFSPDELQSHGRDDPYVAIRGEVFTIKDYSHPTVTNKQMLAYAGQDVTKLFPVQVSSMCDGVDPNKPIDSAVTLDNITDFNALAHDFRYYRYPDDPSQWNWYRTAIQSLRVARKKGMMGYSPQALTTGANASPKRIWASLNDRVYDLTAYASGLVYLLNPGGNVTIPDPATASSILDPNLVELFRANTGLDISRGFQRLYARNAGLRKRMQVCLANLFLAGDVDQRNSLRCQFSVNFLLATTVILVSVILFKFLAALQLRSLREPEEHDRFVVCQVPCYTESEESLRKTIDSLAVLTYDDKRKLLFIICDGNIVGSGNDRPTPRIVLDILGVDSATTDPEPLSFLSLGEGMQQHNMGKVYAGLYECQGHAVPYIVVVKVGRPMERARPGNRGKRDSQMVLMRFFNKVHFNAPMTPLELELYHQVKNVIGVNPSFYEFVLMVDADTTVTRDSLNRMVSVMVHDQKIMGLCGETRLANEKDSWVTMIQVYEYYISHHLAKAFESLFGSVTCLPGCFCMYRLRTPDTGKPLLVSATIIDDYSENRVDTLHKKNLLSLGEDRYLTTLMMKHFPRNKMCFTPDAICETNAPESWAVLLSQRRRWINSTIHNLFELVWLPRLCGFCCFSMRFVVFIDLLATIILPATVIYLAYLVYQVATNPSRVPLISLVMLAAIYGLQAIIFVLKRKWEHIGWMIVYLVAIPVFNLFIPVYSFWHFDDFSWGNTRVVVGEKGRRIHKAAVETEKFDPRSIPTKKWSEYEEELWEVGTQATHVSHESHVTRYTQKSAAALSRPPSAAGLYATGGRSSTAMLAPHMQSPVDYRSRSLSPAAAYMAAPPAYSPSAQRAYSRSRERPSSHAYASMETLQQPPFSAAPHAYYYDPFNGGSNGSAGDLGQMSRPLSSATGSNSPALPSDEEILQELRNVIGSHNLMQITKKQVRDELSNFFGVDMSARKDYINNCIDLILRGQL